MTRDWMSLMHNHSNWPASPGGTSGNTWGQMSLNSFNLIALLTLRQAAEKLQFSSLPWNKLHSHSHLVGSWFTHFHSCCLICWRRCTVQWSPTMTSVRNWHGYSLPASPPNCQGHVVLKQCPDKASCDSCGAHATYHCARSWFLVTTVSYSHFALSEHCPTSRLHIWHVQPLQFTWHGLDMIVCTFHPLAGVTDFSSSHFDPSTMANTSRHLQTSSTTSSSSQCFPSPEIASKHVSTIPITSEHPHHLHLPSNLTQLFPSSNPSPPTWPSAPTCTLPSTCDVLTLYTYYPPSLSCKQCTHPLAISNAWTRP